jgi:hypothetical protein
MVVAGVYACMPIQVEAVAWMGARFDLLSSALTLWAVVFYLWFRESRRPSAYAVSILLYVLATFSKESSFVLPLLIVAMEFILFSPRRIWAPIGLFGAGFLSFAYRWYALHGVGGYSSDGRLAALDISVKSLEGLLLRGPTQVLTGLNWAQPPAAVVIMLGSLTATALVLLSVGTSPSRQTWRYVKLGAAWALLSMLPAHFLLLVGATLTNSRVFYLPTAGAALAVGHLVLALPRHRIREVGAAVLALLMALGVVHNLRAWLWTSQASSELLSAVVQLQPSPLPQTEFVFENLPKALRGVFFFHVALTEGVRLAYRRDDLTARRKEDPPSESPHRVNLLWTGDPNAPLQMQPAE